MPNNGRINWLGKLHAGHTHLIDTYLFLEAANGRTVDRCFSQDWLVVAEEYCYSYAILQFVI